MESLYPQLRPCHSHNKGTAAVLAAQRGQKRNLNPLSEPPEV